MNNIRDFGLEATELQVRYSPEGDTYHPFYRLSDWKLAITTSDVVVGYWEWVRLMVLLEQDQLDRDNPYNSWMREYDT